jgi:diazepam-binding inhibitor (GABA receptor modulating acyl-CoA-binding protein)
MSSTFSTKSQAFENAIRSGRKFDNNTLLQTYAYYKQATEGDNKSQSPSLSLLTFDMKGKAKWDAWNKLKGTSKSQAEQKYIDFVSNMGL